MVDTTGGQLWYGRQGLPVVDGDGGQGGVLLPVEGVRRRQALALILCGRVMGQGLVVAGPQVWWLEGS